MQESNYNWFEVVNRVTEENSQVNEEETVANLEKLFLLAMEASISERDKALLEQSYQAYKCDTNRRSLADRQANALNGLIVTDSESEDPDKY